MQGGNNFNSQDIFNNQANNANRFLNQVLASPQNNFARNSVFQNIMYNMPATGAGLLQTHGGTGGGHMFDQNMHQQNAQFGNQMNGYQNMQQPQLTQQQSSRNNTSIGQKTLQQRRDLAKKFFGTLKKLPKPQFMQNYGILQDTERILQILTNVQYVEKKNQQLMRQNSEENEALADDQGIQQYLRTGNASDEDVSEEEKFDLEDKKILNKRKKRTAKVEDFYFDLDSFIKSKKRLKPSELLLQTTEEDTTFESDKNFKAVLDNKSQLQIKLVEKYFSELPENEHTQKKIINYVKYMVKNMQYSQMTMSTEGSNQTNSEEKVLMDWIMENEPNIVIEIAQFWIYNAFSISQQRNHIEEEINYYQKQLRFLLNTIEENKQILYYSQERFQQWIKFIKGLPEQNETVYSHVKVILVHLNADQIQKGYLSDFIDQIIISHFSMKKQFKDDYLRMLLNEVISMELNQEKFEKMTELIFEKYIDLAKFEVESNTMIIETIIMNFNQLQESTQTNPQITTFCRNTVSLLIEIIKRQPQNSQEFLQMLFTSYFAEINDSMRTILGAKLEEIIKALNLNSDNEELLGLLNSLCENYGFTSYYKVLVKILIDSFLLNGQQLSKEFIAFMMKLVKDHNCTSLLAPIIYQLEYEQVQIYLPQIFVQVRENFDLNELIEGIETTYGADQKKVGELIYYILKQKPELDKTDAEIYIQRLKKFENIVVKKFKFETITDVIERLIRNEKFHCKILISQILLLVKHHTGKETEGQMKDKASNLIKKLLKKKVWDDKKGEGDDWNCIKRGLIIYFGNNTQWSKDLYRLWKDYIPGTIRDEMIKESNELQTFVSNYSRK